MIIIVVYPALCVNLDFISEIVIISVAGYFFKAFPFKGSHPWMSTV